MLQPFVEMKKRDAGCCMNVKRKHKIEVQTLLTLSAHPSVTTLEYWNKVPKVSRVFTQCLPSAKKQKLRKRVKY